MKKLMTSTIIVLPLIILAIMLVSGAVKSLITHIYVESVEFTQNNALVLVMGDENDPPSFDLGSQINILPVKASNRNVKFTSDDTSYVSVTDDGIVTAVGYGETYITVTSEENVAATARRKVIVTDSSVHALKINENINNLYKGETARLTVDVIPYEAVNKKVLWSTDNESVLSVSQSGELTCNGAGTAKITVSSLEKPEITASIEIRCHEALAGISTEISSVTTAAKTEQFPELIITPSNATYTVEYTSSDNNIAEVDPDGKITVNNAGVVEITATAKDDRNHIKSVSVTYHCTDGYYMGALFENNQYSFDYDDFAGRTLNEITLQKSPEGSYRQIIEVTYSRDGIIKFDENSEKFTLQKVSDDIPLGTVTVTIKAKKYDYENDELKEFLTDICNIEITRKTKTLSFGYNGENDRDAITTTRKSLNIVQGAAGTASSGIVITASPANHTDKITYSVSGDAQIVNGNQLVFNASTGGNATLTAATDNNVSKSVTVTYVEPTGTNKEVTVNSEQPNVNVVLQMNANDTSDTGILQVTPPDGMTAKYESSDDSIISVQGDKILPLKGGFAVVTVTFVPTEANEDNRNLDRSDVKYTINVYVDAEVLTENISFDKENGFITSKDSVEYTVTLKELKEGAMEGKELFVDGVKADSDVYNGTKNIAADRDEETITAVIKYSAKALECLGLTENQSEVCSASRTVRSSHGKLLSEPVVTYNETEYKPSDDKTININFNDIGEKVTLKVDIPSPLPADFLLKEGDIKFTSENRFDYEVKYTGNSAEITITAVKIDNTGEETSSLSVGGYNKSFNVFVKITTSAKSMTVNYGEIQLMEEIEYTTLLNNLTLDVEISRDDGHIIIDKNVYYSVNGVEKTEVCVNGNMCTITLDLGQAGDKTVVIRSGEAKLTLQIKKIDLTDADLNLSFAVECVVDGKTQEIETFTIDDDKTIDILVPTSITAFDIALNAEFDENSLGKFDQEVLNDSLIISQPQGWNSEIKAANSKIEIRVADTVDKKQLHNVTLTLNGKTVTLSVLFSDLVYIELPDFDSGDKSNGGDVFKGYQQVRVFAKHSYYDKEVDYLRIQYITKKNIVTDESADPEDINWVLTDCDDNSGNRSVLTTQFGKTVNYKGEVYTIVPVQDGPSKLMKDDQVIAEGGKYADGASERIPWVDVYAEDGYAHIYFGDFKGLSETDVQNDYFGNFGELENWEKVDDLGADYAEKEGSGRDFAASENAYSFLRVEAGDGVKGSRANAHFNFNVLEDNDLYNVFNAQGYYAHSNVVLQSDLYGVGELDESNDKFNEATQNDLFLTEVANLGKTVIYGNGYQVNLQAKTASMDVYSESDGIAINRAYNTIVKCANPTDTISNKNQKIVLKMAYAYYCDLSYYYKFNPVGGTFYTKNTVFSYVPKTAIQLYYNGQALYAENIVMTECGTAIQADNANEQEVKIYYKGTIDILNYFNQPALNNLNPLVSMMFGEVVKGVGDFFEWHGKDISATAQMGGANVDKAYVNVLAFAAKDLSSKTYVWSDGGYKTLSEGGGTLSNGAKIACKALIPDFSAYYALTYEMVNDEGKRLDNATTQLSGSKFTGTADMDKLFAEDRYIRLQCEFKKPGEKNYDHILWHKQNVYRDKSLIVGRKSHIDDLKESLKNTTWDDGSGVNAEGEPYGPTTPMTVAYRQFSEAVIPQRREL